MGTVRPDRIGPSASAFHPPRSVTEARQPVHMILRHIDFVAGRPGSIPGRGQSKTSRNGR